VQLSETLLQTDAVKGDLAKHAGDRNVDWLSIDAMRLVDTLHYNIWLAKKKKRGGLYQIFDKFIGDKDKDKDSSKPRLSFNHYKYEQREPAVQNSAEVKDDEPPQPLSCALTTAHILVDL